MRLSQLPLLTPFAAVLLLVACDSSPQSAQSPSVRRAAVSMPEAPSGGSVASATDAARAVGEIAASGARVVAANASDQVEEDVPSHETALRAQLMGFNRNKKAEEAAAAQVEPAEPQPEAQKVVQRRRRPARVEAPDESDLTPESAIGLSDGEFQDTVNNWRGIKGCIAQNAGHMDSRSGALQLSFQIGADGRVENCKVLDMSNAVAQAIAPCVRKKARRIRFPTFQGDDATKVAKFVF